MCDVATIPKTYERLKKEGYAISLCTLRRWVKQGILPAAFAGQKALVYYPNLLKILHEGTEQPDTMKQK